MGRVAVLTTGMRLAFTTAVMLVITVMVMVGVLVEKEGGVDVAVVALLVHLPSPGSYSAPNPTVGIGAI